MRVLVAPDSFGDALTAVTAASAIAAGWRAAAPGDELDLAPMSDGGPGFVGVLATALSGDLMAVATTDPLGRAATGFVLVAEGSAYVESAHACGLHLMATGERDPRRASTRGLAALIRAADATGVEQIVVGLGGSGTNDGGRGMWEGLGGRPPRARLVAATDVDNPLLGPAGASAVFGPQKGADRATVLDLDDRLRQWADVVENEVGRPGLRDAAGAGAAGGLGFALLALGASRRSGVGVVAASIRLAERAAQADVVVTGEGRLDGQSLRGKVPAGVAQVALDAGIPCIAVAGEVTVARRELAAYGVAEAFAVADDAGGVAAALAAGPGALAVTAARAARRWGGGASSGRG